MILAGITHITPTSGVLMSKIFNYLPGFDAVCRTLTISDAAAELDITQPSLTRQMQKLEEEIGVELFIRQQRGVALTEHGKLLWEVLEPSLESLTHRIEALKSSKSSNKGRIRIGTLTEIGKTFTIPRMLRYGRDFPDVVIEINLLSTDEIFTKLANRDLDLGIVARLPDQPSFIASKIFDETIVMVSRSANINSMNDTGDVLKAKFVTYRRNDPIYEAFMKRHFPTIKKPEQQVQMTINDHRSIVEAVLGHDYFAILPYASVASFIASGILRVVSDKTISSSVYLARPDHQIGKITQSAVRYLINEASSKSTAQ
jgi:DNA-binding transcriptional LysR family regulator